MPDYDVIVIGAGNNGLACATLLAKQGLKVLDIERNKNVGGMAGTHEVFPGHRSNFGAFQLYFVKKKVLEMLDVWKHGLELISPDDFQFNIASEEYPPFMYSFDMPKMLEHVSRDFGQDVSEGFIRVMEFFAPFTTGMNQALYDAPISISKMIELMPSIEAKDALRKLFYRSVVDVFEEFIPSERAIPLKAALYAMAVDGFYGDPTHPGTAFNIAFHLTTGEGRSHMVKGGIGNYCEAIARAFKANGGELMLNASVKKVLMKDNQAIGVELEDGTKISSRMVASNCGARYSFMNLVGEKNLPAQFTGMVKSIDYRNPFAQMWLRVKDLPRYEGRFSHLNDSGTQHMPCLLPPLRDQQIAWQACTAGEVPPKPVVMGEIPAILDPTLSPKGEYTISTFMMYFPIAADRKKWKGLAEQYADNIIQEWTKYAPNYKDIILDRVVWTPEDHETRFNATNGDFCHGRFSLDQMLDFRPVPGWTNYRTPVDKFYLCGSACHPGYGVTSLPGINCANKIKQDLKQR